MSDLVAHNADQADRACITRFVAPVLSMYSAGQPIEDDQKHVIMKSYAKACGGYTADVYSAAREKMFAERLEPFRPTPAECKQWLEKAKAVTPGAAEARRLSRFHSSFSGPWRSVNGRLNPEDYQDIPEPEWRKAFEFIQREIHSREPSKLFDALRTAGVNTTRADCPIPPALVTEYGLPTTKDDLEKITLLDQNTLLSDKTS